MTHSRRCLAAFLFLLCCAQTSPKEREIVIVVYLVCPHTPSVAPSIVIDAVDFPPVPLTYEKSLGAWTGRWIDNRKKGTIAEAPPLASLRLGGHRTYCRRAVPGKVGDETAAVFRFECDDNPASDVSVEARKGNDDDVAYSYERTLRKISSGALKDDEPCTESARRQGTATITDVRLGESLLLRFGEHLTDLPVNLPLQLNGTAVISAFVRGRVEAKLSPPVLSPISIDLDQQAIQDTGLARLNVMRVQK